LVLSSGRIWGLKKSADFSLFPKTDFVVVDHVREVEGGVGWRNGGRSVFQKCFAEIFPPKKDFSVSFFFFIIPMPVVASLFGRVSIWKQNDG
jgi:hypothetical protein